MEGTWRGLAVWLACAVAACSVAGLASGCGDEPSQSAEPKSLVVTSDPERAFAPLVELAADEPWQPMGARWFIERSIFWFAEDEGCADRKIAVGHAFPEQQNPTIDWIYPKGLGGWSWPSYFRNPYDERCELDFDLRFYADQLTRPHDPGPRVEGVRPGEGFYLDLADAARPGPQGVAAQTYVDRADEGDGAIRFTYWMLFGMHGTPGAPDAHEGDWVRVDVLARDEGDRRYLPTAVQLGAAGHEVAWSAIGRRDATHPVVELAKATHEPAPAGDGAERCADCRDWPTWRSLAPVRKELWFGFGGAWGEPGTDDATTGPLGPHGRWMSAEQKERQVLEQSGTSEDGA